MGVLAGCATGPRIGDTEYMKAYVAEEQEHRAAEERELAARIETIDDRHEAEAERRKQYVAARDAEYEAQSVRAASAAAIELDALREEAKKHGYQDLVRTERGLTGVLEGTVAHAVDLRQLRPYAFELTDFVDQGFVATQILGKRVRFTSAYTDNQIILQKYKGAVYENTSLYALDFVAVKVVGVENYRTVMGGTAQAFVVEPAW